MEFIVYVETDNSITKSGNVKEKNIIKKTNTRYACTCETHPETRSQAHGLPFSRKGLVSGRQEKFCGSPAGPPLDSFLSHLRLE